MTELYEFCKIEWEENYQKKENAKKEFNAFIRDFDMTGKNDFVRFPVSSWFRWKCPCCNNYLDIQKLKNGKIVHYRYVFFLIDDMIFTCNKCGYKYGYHYVSGFMCNP